MRPDLDDWLADPALRIAHRCEAEAGPAQLWEAARSVRLADTRVLGRLVRWRIPGLPALAVVRPLIAASHSLIESEAMAVTVRRAEAGAQHASG